MPGTQARARQRQQCEQCTRIKRRWMMRHIHQTMCVFVCVRARACMYSHHQTMNECDATRHTICNDYLKGLQIQRSIILNSQIFPFSRHSTAEKYNKKENMKFVSAAKQSSSSDAWSSSETYKCALLVVVKCSSRVEGNRVCCIITIMVATAICPHWID